MGLAHWAVARPQCHISSLYMTARNRTQLQGHCLGLGHGNAHPVYQVCLLLPACPYCFRWPLLGRSAFLPCHGCLPCRGKATGQPTCTSPPVLLGPLPFPQIPASSSHCPLCHHVQYKTQFSVVATAQLRVLANDAKANVTLLLKATGTARLTFGGTSVSITGALANACSADCCGELLDSIATQCLCSAMQCGLCPLSSSPAVGMCCGMPTCAPRCPCMRTPQARPQCSPRPSVCG